MSEPRLSLVIGGCSWTENEAHKTSPIQVLALLKFEGSWIDREGPVLWCLNHSGISLWGKQLFIENVWFEDDFNGRCSTKSSWMMSQLSQSEALKWNRICQNSYSSCRYKRRSPHFCTIQPGQPLAIETSMWLHWFFLSESHQYGI